jgi:hypothetical protein
MRVQKMVDDDSHVVPLIAALPYAIEADIDAAAIALEYDPIAQRTIYSGKDYSTSREDDSAGGIFSSKNDTKKDD